jgi:YHS domain-containing protein
MKTVLTIFFLLINLCLFAQAENASRRRSFNTENFIALRQFDPVSYFQSKPTKGSEKIQHDYKGITYYFISEQNREAFKKSPEKYEPAYGGWCAYTLATTGERIRVDPTAYRIVDGKLLLFYNFNGDNRLVKWHNNPDKKNLIASANKKWKMR